VAIGATVTYPSAATGWGASYGGLTTVVDYSDVWTWTTTNNQVTIDAYTGAGGVVIIPASIDGAAVTAIGENAFLGNSSLASVMIPVAAVLGIDAFPSTTTILRYLTEAQLTSRDSAQNAAGRAAGLAEGREDVESDPNTYGLYDLSQVQALNVGTPLLTKDSATGKFKLTIGVEKSTNLVNFSPMDIPVGAAMINAQGKMEFEFTAPDNAAFYRLESR